MSKPDSVRTELAGPAAFVSMREPETCCSLSEAAHVAAAVHCGLFKVCR